MADLPYRKASENTGLWITLLLLGVAGQLAVMLVLHGRSHWRPQEAWFLVIGIVPFVLMMFLAAAKYLIVWKANATGNTRLTTVNAFERPDFGSPRC